MSEIALSQRLTLLLDESSLNRTQRWLWVLSTGGTLLDGFVIFALGVAMPLIIAEFHIKPEVVGLIGAALVLMVVVAVGLLTGTVPTTVVTRLDAVITTSYLPGTSRDR